MKSLCIIPCGKKKIWDTNPFAGTVKAEQAYIGALHKKSRAYAEAFCSDYRIISAKHGFLSKNDLLNENYNLTFDHATNMKIKLDQLTKQAEKQKLHKYDKIIALTGRKYMSVINGVFKEGPRVEYPLLNQKGIGYILQSLDHAVNNNRPLH